MATISPEVQCREFIGNTVQFQRCVQYVKYTKPYNYNTKPGCAAVDFVDQASFLQNCLSDRDNFAVSTGSMSGDFLMGGLNNSFRPANALELERQTAQMQASLGLVLLI